MLEADAGCLQKTGLKSHPFWALQKESPVSWGWLGCCWGAGCLGQRAQPRGAGGVALSSLPALAQLGTSGAAACRALRGCWDACVQSCNNTVISRAHLEEGLASSV